MVASRSMSIFLTAQELPQMSRVSRSGGAVLLFQDTTMVLPVLMLSLLCRASPGSVGSHRESHRLSMPLPNSAEVWGACHKRCLERTTLNRAPLAPKSDAAE